MQLSELINFREFGFTGNFAGINLREFGFTENFAGINVRELSLTKDFWGINFREHFLQRFRKRKFNVFLKEYSSTTLVYGFANSINKNWYFFI